MDATAQHKKKTIQSEHSYFFRNTNSASLCQLSSDAIMEQCFIGSLLGNKAIDSNSNNTETVIWLEAVLTFVITEYVKTINSAVGSPQISQAIALIR